MNKVVIATQNAMEGIITNTQINHFVEDDPIKQQRLILQLSQENNLQELGCEAGQWVKINYQWNEVLSPLKNIILNGKNILPQSLNS